MFGWLACAPSEEAPKPPSLVLVTMDTTRADRIGAYGYDHASTPSIDALAAEGARFDAAFTTVPLTIPAHASILSGTYPPSLGVRVNGDHPLPAEATTLAEILSEHGYTTIASVGAYVTTRVWAFDQGFDTFDDALPDVGGHDRWGLERAGPQVISAVGEALQGAPADKPVFVWAHLYDPHEPYAPPGIFMSRGLDAYDSEIAFADAQIGRLRKMVERFAGEAGVAFVVVADHGEGLDGDPERGHGTYLYDDTLRVPFVVRAARPGPERSGPVVVDAPVSVVDVLPTALGLVGIAPPAGIDGVDLSGALRGEAVSRGPVYAESEAARLRFGWAPEVVAIDGRMQLYDTPRGGLRDRGADQAPLQPADPAAEARLRTFVEEIRGRSPVGASREPGPVAAQLEALGYVSALPLPGSGPPVVDAKDRAAAVRSLDEARHLNRRPGGRREAEAIWRSVLASDPDIAEARLEVVAILDRTGRRDEALAMLEEGLALAPDSAQLRVNRARLLLAVGRAAAAAADAERVLSADPSNRAAQEVQIEATSPPEAALALVRSWQSASPDDPFLHAMAGEILVELERFDEAEPELRSAASVSSPWLGVHRALAQVEAHRRRFSEVRVHLEAEVEHFPDDPPAWHALGEFQLDTLRDYKAASASFERVLSSHPADLVARRGLAAALLGLGDLHGASSVLEPLMPSDDPEVLEVAAGLLAAKGETAEATKLRERIRKAR